MTFTHSYRRQISADSDSRIVPPRPRDTLLGWLCVCAQVCVLLSGTDTELVLGSEQRCWLHFLYLSAILSVCSVEPVERSSNSVLIPSLQVQCKAINTWKDPVLSSSCPKTSAPAAGDLGCAAVCVHGRLHPAAARICVSPVAHSSHRMQANTLLFSQLQMSHVITLAIFLSLVFARKLCHRQELSILPSPSGRTLSGLYEQVV